MRIIEFANGLQIPITNEESDFLARFEKSKSSIDKTTLTEREKILANHLVYRGLLIRKNNQGHISYTLADNKK